jgi:putative nucleotidyltransferase with HDIG domain
VSSHRPDERANRWEQHRFAGATLRALAILLPFAASLATILLLAHLIPRPHGDAVLLWYVAICAVSWGVLAVVQRPLSRLLPLAVLLELALVFPDRAPSRAVLAHRAGSTRELRRLLAAPADETVQQAAERVLALVGVLARHDRKTRGHAERVRALTDLLAERMSLPERDRDRLRWAALLHDIGKLRVPTELLNKDGKPTSTEWDVIRQHPEHGAEIAAPLMEWLDGWGDVIVQHHERWDGGGYPHRLSGEQICLGARIVSVADAYDVMTSTRAYKKPIGHPAALRELTRCSGGQFDPAVVRAMVAVPNRRLIVAVGPLSWVTGLPVIGQSTAVASTVAAQTGTALGAAALAGATALTPAFGMSPAPHPAPVTKLGHQHAKHPATTVRPAAPTATATRAQPPRATRPPQAHHHRQTARRPSAPATRPRPVAVPAVPPVPSGQPAAPPAH